MSGFSNYLGNAALNWMRGTAMPTAALAATLYVCIQNYTNGMQQTVDFTGAGSGLTTFTGWDG